MLAEAVPAGGPAESETRPHLTTRQKARKRAVDIIFEADLRERDLRATLREREEQAEPAVRAFTAQLVAGVADHLVELDDRIRQVLPSGWSLERMPRVDRSVTRLATYELAHTATDTNIVVAEATRLTSELSVEDSVRFVNGVLGTLARQSVDERAAAPTSPDGAASPDEAAPDA